MITALMILVAVLMVVGIACLVNQAVSGCPFAWLWLCCGGMTAAVELLFKILAEIASGLTGGN
jgi:hypothetical protein